MELQQGAVFFRGLTGRSKAEHKQTAQGKDQHSGKKHQLSKAETHRKRSAFCWISVKRSWHLKSPQPVCFWVQV